MMGGHGALEAVIKTRDEEEKFGVAPSYSLVKTTPALFLLSLLMSSGILVAMLVLELEIIGVGMGGDVVKKMRGGGVEMSGSTISSSSVVMLDSGRRSMPGSFPWCPGVLLPKFSWPEPAIWEEEGLKMGPSRNERPWPHRILVHSHNTNF